MTIICAIHEPGRGTWIGTDSQCTAGDRILPGGVVKHIQLGPFWLLHSGSPRALLLLQKHQETLSVERSAFDLGTAIREVWRADGFVSKDDKGFSVDFDQRLIFATDQGAWDCDGCFDVTPWPSGHLCARGAGLEYALGAAHALRHETPETQLRAALAAACEFSTGCGGPQFVRLVEV